MSSPPTFHGNGNDLQNKHTTADAEGMRKVMEEINRLETTSFEQPKYVEFREYAPLLALVALALILLGFTAETTWKLRLP